MQKQKFYIHYTWCNFLTDSSRRGIILMQICYLNLCCVSLQIDIEMNVINIVL